MSITTDLQEQEAIVRWLCTSAAYPHRPADVQHVQTHISHVFLASERVYKLKKAVRFDFLDFSTRENREHACREEVRLNRRLAADAYLSVVPVMRTSAGYQLGGEGDVADWLVEMRRLPTELTLDALHRRSELTTEHIDRLARVLVRFYTSLPPLEIRPEDYRRRTTAHVRGNFGELLKLRHHLPRGAVERVHAFQLQCLALQPELFDERVRDGRIVDGHGDLRPEHICLSEPIAIFDCLEFSADLRRIDVADELAFLAAECDFLGANWVGPRVFEAYQAASGDRPPAILWDFYRSYRACVRAKVAALRADQLEGDPQTAAAAEANRHLTLADGYAAGRLCPLVIVVGGLSGTGKTTLAGALARALGAELLRTDLIRRQLYTGTSKIAGHDEGIYDRQSRHRVYDDMFVQARALHADRVSVVLDGTFSSAELVSRAHDLAVDSQALFLAVECVCRPEVAHERIDRRLAAGGDASEARPEIHELQRKAWQVWPSVPQVPVDTEQPLEEQVAAVVTALRAAAR